MNFKAYQKDKPDLRQDFAVIQINITDVNDNAPVMSQSNYTVSIPENMQNNQTVLWVHASDADEVSNIVGLDFFIKFSSDFDFVK